ncbi:cobalamin biosynthesis protein, partial [Azotobacter beijerinckii]|nr:cobalamin biosynthesis protein [Azotobacter beijerinckii]
MSLGLSLLAGVALDAALGEPRRYHPLVGFGR